MRDLNFISIVYSAKYTMIMCVLGQYILFYTAIVRCPWYYLALPFNYGLA